MKFNLIALIFLSSSLLSANNFHTTLLLPRINITNPTWSYTGKKISQKEDEVFIKLIEKWEAVLTSIYDKLDAQIYEDIGASINTLDFYMEDQRFIDAYNDHCQKTFANIIDEQIKIDPVLTNYISQKLTFLQLTEPITIYTSDDISFPAISFGSSQQGHCFILKRDTYNKNNIQDLYKSAQLNIYKFNVMPPSQNHSSRVIEYTNYLQLGITQAVSMILHQGDYFAKMLLFFMYNNKFMSEATQRYGTSYIYFHSFLEACLQSNNPLETAIFIEPFLDNADQEFVFLWRELIEDIQNCYDVQDLQAYEALVIAERRANLYTNQNE